MPLSTRSSELELLDGAQLDPSELRRNLREMAMLNRLPGGVEASVKAVLGALDGRADASVLDIGAGSGDFAQRLARRRDVVLLVGDSRPEVLAIARRNLANTNRVEFIDADVRALPLPDGAVDVVHASLLLHHLTPTEGVEAFREMRRVAREAVVVNDLRRSRAAFLMTAAPVLAFGRSPYTRHDGVASARRAYTLPELDAIAAQGGLRVVSRTAPWWPRVTTVYR
ncbi:MAG TPA: methyltransferase domain-containing protein [Candidatus Limnocylindria bacterium]|jgi:SAM-dependent methyltransferase|nr:methyltransferase domain-containing protein [Candidatus Limnocylindria bacterium]